ncbi:hypothetical protein [Planococcus faecalis]|uniref:hypothetical protein n=1 Tax=Planococcus faecalis TaxID=1598147 RepID=UPI000910014F|nr:hypothetical protein [Planococcus faecalis]OHX51638.1 hypothetical protein BB777_15815 [Planococcus faecalis]
MCTKCLLKRDDRPPNKKVSDEMNITMYVSVLSEEKQAMLTQLIKKKLESIDYEDQAEMDEIISNGLDS